MSINTSTHRDENPPAEIPVRTEEVGFRPEEMSACPACKRPNGPNRLKCMYCAAELTLPATIRDDVTLAMRRLENWEKGWNLITAAQSSIGAESAAKVSRILGADADEIDDLLALTKPFPIARVESAAAAEILSEKLAAVGLRTLILSDEQLAPGWPPVRLRGVEFNGDKFVFSRFNAAEVETVDPPDIRLIVTGTVVESRTDSTSVRKKRQNTPDEETFSSSDEKIIDLYTSDSVSGWRVREKGFDFSCLGEAKSLVAKQNVRQLTEKFRAACPNAEFDDEYDGLRKLLATVWDVEIKKESLGVSRSSFGKINVMSASVVSNLEQFTRYSRMCRHLL